MQQVQIIENETFARFVDTTIPTYILNYNGGFVDSHIHNINEITESFLPNSVKISKLLTELMYEYEDYEYILITSIDRVQSYMVNGGYVIPPEKIMLATINN